jgi:hypothetical protein
MSEVFFEIVSPMPLNSQDEARQLISLWAENAPQFLPDRVGRIEPLWRRFSLESLDEVLRDWVFHFAFKRVASPKLEASVFMQYGPHRLHSTWSISLERLRDFEQAAFCNLLRRSSLAFAADFAFIHHVTEAEIERGQDNDSLFFLDTARTEKCLSVSTHMLLKYIPDVYWITIFGKPYVRLFSRERLLSAPAHRIEELENGSVAIQLTPNLSDSATDEAAFEAVRKTVRDHLGSNAIFDEKKGADHQYAVPQFVWSPMDSSALQKWITAEDYPGIPMGSYYVSVADDS